MKINFKTITGNIINKNNNILYNNLYYLINNNNNYIYCIINKKYQALRPDLIKNKFKIFISMENIEINKNTAMDMQSFKANRQDGNKNERSIT